MPKVTAQELRDIVQSEINSTITIHRSSRKLGDEPYSCPTDAEATEEEINDFVLTNPLLDAETASHLTDPGLLGFLANSATAGRSWLVEFRENVKFWANSNEWLAADLVPYHDQYMSDDPEPLSEIWRPRPPELIPVSFLDHSPSHLLLADELIRNGRLLNELGWREFEALIAELLQTHGWNVTLMQGSKDGGIDVLAERVDPTIGLMRALWQAKKFSSARKVQVSHLRELSGVVESERATKGVLVTTSSLTRGALEWVRRDTYRLESKDGRAIERWVRNRLYGECTATKE